MKLRSHERPQQPRATDVFHRPEQNEWETFEAGHVIRRVIQVAQERLVGMEKFLETRESAVLLFASRPDLIPALYHNQKKMVEIYMADGWGEDQTLNIAIMRKMFADEGGVLNLSVSQIESKLPRVLESLGFSAGGNQPLKFGVILAAFMPDKRKELQSAVQKTKTDWLNKIDLPDLNPNVYPASSGALLRLLDPSATAPLKEILSRRAGGWIRQIEDSMSPESTAKYTSRGLKFYLPWALRESLGLEILLADEALIDDEGNFVITRHTKSLGASTPLPMRPLN